MRFRHFVSSVRIGPCVGVIAEDWGKGELVVSHYVASVPLAVRNVNTAAAITYIIWETILNGNSVCVYLLTASYVMMQLLMFICIQSVGCDPCTVCICCCCHPATATIKTIVWTVNGKLFVVAVKQLYCLISR